MMQTLAGGTPKNSSSCCGQGFARPNTSDVSQSAWLLRLEPTRKDCEIGLVGICFQRDRHMGRETRNEFADLDSKIRRIWGALHIQQAAQIRAFHAAWKEVVTRALACFC